MGRAPVCGDRWIDVRHHLRRRDFHGWAFDDTPALGARGYLLDVAGHSHRSDAYTTLHFPGATSAALGVDKRGVIVGGYTKDAVRHSYLLIDNTYFTLDVPGCSAPVVGGAMTCTTPRKVNDAGQIVGFYGAGGTAVRGFLAIPQ